MKVEVSNNKKVGGKSPSTLALQLKEFKLCSSKEDRVFPYSISVTLRGLILCLVTVRDDGYWRAEDGKDSLPIQQQNLTDEIQWTNFSLYMQHTSFREKEKLSCLDHFYDLMGTSIPHHPP